MIMIIHTKRKKLAELYDIYSLKKNDLLQLEAEIALSQFESERKKREIYEEFSILEKITFLKEHQKRLNEDPLVQHLNRYIDILPCTYYNNV